MRYIDLTRTMREEKFRLYIGETAFILKDVRKTEKYLNEVKKELTEMIRTNDSKSKIEDWKSLLVGQTYILPFPLTPDRDIQPRQDLPFPYGTKKDNTTILTVCESVEEIYKLIEEADKRENRKKFEVFKHLL